MYALEMGLRLTARSYFTVTIATVNRPITARLEGYLRVLTTLGAYRREHLAAGTVVATSGALCLPCLAAFGTALGFISKTLGLQEFLFLSAEVEGSPAIGALERLILKTHWMTSSLLNFS